MTEREMYAMCAGYVARRFMSVQKEMTEEK